MEANKASMACYSAAPGIECSRVGTRAVLFDPNTGKASILNAAGALLWERLSSPRTAEELRAFLASEYPGLGMDQAESDTRAFLESLLGAGLVRAISSGGRP